MGFAVKSSEISDLDGKIQNLVADVNKAALILPVLALQSTDFFRRWVQWRDVHTTFLAQTGIPNFESGLDASKVNAEFLGFTSEYNEKRRQFIASGGSTSAKEMDPNNGPLDSAASTTGTVVKVGFVALAAYVLYKIFGKETAK